jgi:hypothetical protein
MTALSVKPPFPIFTDTAGQPLEDGFIYIGIANQDPVTNPITVYWDVALTVPATQPIRTLAGYPSRAGTPAVLYVNNDYSITVKNKNNALVYQSLNDNAFSGGVVVLNATGTGSQIIFAVSSIPSAIYINGVYQNQNTYTVGAGTITFSEAPPVTSTIEFVL